MNSCRVLQSDREGESERERGEKVSKIEKHFISALRHTSEKLTRKTGRQKKHTEIYNPARAWKNNHGKILNVDTFYRMGGWCWGEVEEREEQARQFSF